MKTSTLIILFALIILRTQAQQQDGYYINFTGEGDTTGLGAVQVINMTNRDTVNMNGDDILHLNTTLLGVKIHDANKRAMQVYPNPMTDQSTVTFVATENGEVTIRIIDVSGKTLSQSTRYLSPGTHSYCIFGISSGMFIVQVVGKNYAYSSKLISQSSKESHTRIEYSGSKILDGNLKSTAGTVEMRYISGDQLLFRGRTGDFKRLVTDIPTYNKTVVFHFVNCRDVDGNNYETVKIGNQTWMAENLRVTRFKNKANIRINTDRAAVPAYCWYQDNEFNYKIPYGALYNYYAITDTRGICPADFRVPSDNDWNILTSFLGYSAIAGGKMKTPGTYEDGTSLWRAPNIGATNSSGFCGIPGGCFTQGNFYGIDIEGDWWSINPSIYRLATNSMGLLNQNQFKYIYQSVRCVRDY